MTHASAESVREAVAAGDYIRALELWQEYTRDIAAAGPTRESLAEAAKLIEEVRPPVLAARSRAQERLRALHVAGVYGAPRRTRASIRTSL